VNGANDHQVYGGSAKSGLNGQLQAGLTLAQAKPGAVPDPLPNWLNAKYDRLDTEPNVAIYNAKARKQYKHKWARPFANLSGDLPGVIGLGGYLEYYAEPSPSAKENMEATGQRFGTNRILKQTNAVGKTYWWATADHYDNVSFITDA